MNAADCTVSRLSGSIEFSVAYKRERNGVHRSLTRCFTATLLQVKVRGLMNRLAVKEPLPRWKVSSNVALSLSLSLSLSFFLFRHDDKSCGLIYSPLPKTRARVGRILNRARLILAAIKIHSGTNGVPLKFNSRTRSRIQPFLRLFLCLLFVPSISPNVGKLKSFSQRDRYFWIEIREPSIGAVDSNFVF